jgi:hypothetical protein
MGNGNGGVASGQGGRERTTMSPVCREVIKSQISSSVAVPLSRIEATVKAMDDKLSEFMELFDRVRTLEIWRAEHDGRQNGELRTRRSDCNSKRLVVPKWMVYSTGLLIVVLAALSGDKVIVLLELLWSK